MHHNLKPSNILIDENEVPIITDFGLSQLITHSTMTVFMCWGSLGYEAPEIYEKMFTKHSKECDIFALGIIFYELCTGRKPYGKGASFK